MGHCKTSHGNNCINGKILNKGERIEREQHIRDISRDATAFRENPRGIHGIGFAELPPLERGSSATKSSQAVKPAYIRMIKRRIISPVSARVLDILRI